MNALPLLLALSLSHPALSPSDCENLGQSRALLARAGLSTASVDALLARCPRARVERPGVELFHFTDRCANAPVAVVGPRSSCEALAPAGASIWSVRVDGRCIDTEDLPFLDACRRFQARAPVGIYRSDRCEGRLVATTGPRVDCAALPDAGTSAWGVEMNGRCVNIPDTSPRAACERYRYGPPG